MWNLEITVLRSSESNDTLEGGHNHLVPYTSGIMVDDMKHKHHRVTIKHAQIFKRPGCTNDPNLNHNHHFNHKYLTVCDDF